MSARLRRRPEASGEAFRSLEEDSGVFCRAPEGFRSRVKVSEWVLTGPYVKGGGAAEAKCGGVLQAPGGLPERGGGVVRAHLVLTIFEVETLFSGPCLLPGSA